MTEDAAVQFHGRSAVVTGGAGGLGLAYATELAKRGARVVVSDLAHSNLISVIGELRQSGLDLHPVAADMAQEEQVEQLFAEAIEHLGRIDILINNAGNAIPGTVFDASTSDMVSSLQVHVMGSFWAMRAVAKHMAEHRYGRIVNTTSSLGVFGAPSSVPYVTAKAAVAGLTRAASLDCAEHGILVNAIAPVAYTPLAKPFLDHAQNVDREKLTADGVTPAAMYLAHEICDISGALFSAQAGRIARIFSAVGPGYRNENLSAQDVEQHLEEILSTSGAELLPHALAEFSLFPQAL